MLSCLFSFIRNSLFSLPHSAHMSSDPFVYVSSYFPTSSNRLLLLVPVLINSKWCLSFPTFRRSPGVRDVIAICRYLRHRCEQFAMCLPLLLLFQYPLPFVSWHWLAFRSFSSFLLFQLLVQLTAPVLFTYRYNTFAFFVCFLLSFFVIILGYMSLFSVFLSFQPIMSKYVFSPSK